MKRMPEGELPATGAERQARYRARLRRLSAGGMVVPGGSAAKPRPLTRPQRWQAAVGALVALQAEYAAWYDALPEATRDGPTGEALLAIVEIDLDELIAIQPPRGFGRD